MQVKLFGFGHFINLTSSKRKKKKEKKRKERDAQVLFT